MRGALDVGGEDFAAVPRPEAIVGRDVKDIAHPGHRAPDGIPVAEIAFEEIQIQPIEMPARTCATDQGAHREAGLEQFARDGRAHEAARPAR